MREARAGCLMALICLLQIAVQAQSPLPSIAEKTKSLDKLDGFIPLYWDRSEGRLWLEVPTLETEMLYVTSLSAGLGSNDIGLDRGQLGGRHLVVFRRIGRKLLLVAPNSGYRALSPNPDERRAVEEAFARSVLWGFEIAAESEGRVLVDATGFLLRDVHDVVKSLEPATYTLSEERSAVNMERTKAFPRNTEMDALLTFTSNGDRTAETGNGLSGGRVSDVAPTVKAVTVQQHHSFVRLPEPGYVPIPFDPRAGAFSASYYDFAAPMSEPLSSGSSSVIV